MSLKSTVSFLAITLCSLFPFTAAIAQTVAVADLGTLAGYTGSAKVIGTTYEGWSFSSNLSNYSSGYAVSGDGTVIAGTSATSAGAAHAFRWTAAGGMTDLGALGGAQFASTALGASANGGTIVGMSTYSSAGVWHAFKWTQGTGIVDLGSLVTNGGTSYSVALAVNDDGSVIVGGSYTNTSIDHAFRWTQGTGMVDLGVLAAGGWSDAYGVSADGNVITGVTTVASGQQHAFRWTQASGMTDLGTLAAGNSGLSWAEAISKDGLVIVGRSATTAGQQHAFRWTSAGMTDLGTIGNIVGTSAATATSGDGSVVVGASQFASGSPTHAFVWTQGAGMQDLGALLSAGGVNMTGITLNDARGISASGQIITGMSTYAAISGTRAYLARIGGTNGLTTPDAIIESLNRLSSSHQAQLITQYLSAMVFLGANEQVSCSASCGGTYASFGSFNVSAHGRTSLTPEWTLLGGIGIGDYEEKGAKVVQSVTVAAALRFDPANMGRSRPYFEIGTALAPSQALTYNRDYANGSGDAIGQGKTRSSFAMAYVRAGWVARLTPIDEIAGFMGVSQTSQSQDSYAELAGADNPFEAVYAKGTDRVKIASVGAQYSHLYGQKIEMTADLTLNRSFGSRGGIDATVAGLGGQTPKMQEITWAAPGLRLAYRVNKRISAATFVNATIGPKAIGTGVHGGIGISLVF